MSRGKPACSRGGLQSGAAPAAVAIAIALPWYAAKGVHTLPVSLTSLWIGAAALCGRARIVWLSPRRAGPAGYAADPPGCGAAYR